MASKPRSVGFVALVSMVSLVAVQPASYAHRPAASHSTEQAVTDRESADATSAAGRPRPLRATSRSTSPTGAVAIGAPASAGCSSLFYPPDFAAPPSSSTRAVGIGDVNGDGRSDIVIGQNYFVGNLLQSSVWVYPQDATGALLPPVPYLLGDQFPGQYPHSIAVGDVNADGRQDVVVGSGFNPGGIQVLLQNTSGGLDPAQSVSSLSSMHVRVADLNHDGRMDIVGAGWSTRGINVVLQQPNGTLGAPVAYALPFRASDLDIGDVNNDGRIDVIVAAYDSGLENLAVLLQQADGSLAPPSYYSLGSLSTDAVAVGDVTGDGLKDIVASRGSDGSPSVVSVYRQQPSGGLESPDLVKPGFAPASLEVADLNLDGRADIVISHPGGIGVFFQDASGALSVERFSPIRTTADLGFTPALTVGDVDGDGRPDVVLADSTNPLVVLRTPPPNTRQVAACLPDGTAATGQSMTATAWNGPAGTRDWVALAATGAPDTSFLSWKYLNDSATPPTTGLSEGTVHFTTPQIPGTYEIRFFANNTYQRLATSRPFSVTGAPVQPIILVEPWSVAFGSVVVGSAVDRDLTVTNTGTGTLIGSVTTSSPAFTFQGESSFSLAANESTVLPVRFAPQAATRFDELVTFSGGSAGDQNLWLGGTGLAPDTPILHVSPMTASFGSVATGSSAQLRFTVRNVGTGTLVGSPTVTGAGFSLVNGGAYSLAAGGSTVLTVRFTPGSVDALTGSLDLTGGGGATVPLSGMGTGAKLTVSSTLVNPGQVIQVTASGGPGNPKDWVGLHTAAGLDSSYLDWKYLNGLKTAPTVGLTSGVLNFAMPQTPGTYNFRFFANNTFQKLATSETVTVRDTPFLDVSPTSVSFGSVSVGSFSDRQVTVKNSGAGTLTGSGSATGSGYSLVGNTAYSLAHNQTAVLTVRFTPVAAGNSSGTLTLTGGGGATVPLTGGGVLTTLSVSSTTVNPGGTVQVGVSNGPGTPKDWVALARTGAPDGTYLDWKYLNGVRTPPVQGLTSAILNFAMPASAGTYEFRFFKNNTFQKLATSPTVTVPGGPILQVTPTSVSFGSVNVGSAADRTVTVMNVGTQALSGGATVTPPFSMVGTATYSLAPNQSMALKVRLTPLQTGPNDGLLTLTGGAGALVPLHGTGIVGMGPTLTVNSTVVAPGATVQVTLAGGPGNQRDWVGLYTTAAGDMSYLDWKYLSGLRTLPATGLTSAVLTFTMPQAPGTYNFRFFANGTYQKLATSVAVTVQ